MTIQEIKDRIDVLQGELAMLFDELERLQKEQAEKP
jgi:uncharacterized small protein (DUF1192 family)